MYIYYIVDTCINGIVIPEKVPWHSFIGIDLGLSCWRPGLSAGDATPPGMAPYSSSRRARRRHWTTAANRLMIKTHMHTESVPLIQISNASAVFMALQAEMSKPIGKARIIHLIGISRIVQMSVPGWHPGRYVHLCVRQVCDVPTKDRRPLYAREAVIMDILLNPSR